MPTLKILGLTACRSDFDLLSPLFHALDGDARFDFQLLVSGAHLSPRFGRTLEHVRQSGLPIAAELETFVDEDRRSARARTASRWIERAGPVIESAEPDLLIVAGDREDALAACMLAAYLRIPTAHFFGGDHGQTRDVDNLVRHATSKLASLHFVMTEEHRRRLVALGEPNERIHVVGHPALDAFRTTKTIERGELIARRALPIDDQPYAVVIHHPTFSDPDAGVRELEMILGELVRRGMPAVVGLPNVDAGSRAMIDAVHRFAQTHDVHITQGLDRETFINLLRHSAILVGNSSLGLLEAPSVPLGVVNVGARQRGRNAASNVIFADAEPGSIRQAMDEVLSEGFQASLATIVNPYGDGRSVPRAVEIIARQTRPELTDKVFDPLVQGDVG